MTMPDLEHEVPRQEKLLRIQQQIAFVSGLFQEDMTVRTLLESLAEGVVVIDNSGTILLVNARAGQIFGYPKQDLIGQHLAVLVPERFRKAHEEHVAQFFEAPLTKPIGQLPDLVGLRRDGREFPVEIGLCFLDTINGCLGLAFIVDISERKRAEEALWESRNRAQAIITSALDAVVEIDANGTILAWNPKAEKIFGWPADEAIGSRPSETIIPPQYREAHEKGLKHFLATGEGPILNRHIELTALHRDGHEFPVELTVTPVRSGAGYTFTAFLRDITERRLAEEALQESEERFRATFNQAAVGIGHLTPNGRLLRVNKKYCDIVGYTEEELKALTIRDITHPDDMEASIGHIQLMLDGKLQNYSLEKRYIRKDRSIVWINLTASLVADADGNPKFAVGVVEDITPRKLAEEALRFSEARFRALYRDNPVMIVTLDANLIMLSVNPVCASQLGYSIDELEGQSVLKLFHEDDRPAVAEHLQICLRNPDQVYRWQFRKVHKDGGLLWVEEVAQAVADPSGALNLLVVCQDITARKRAEDELKKTSRQNELILASAGEGILGLDLEGNQTFVNSAAAAMLGYDVNELIGKNSHLTWHYSRRDGSSYPVEECPIYMAYTDGIVQSGLEMFWRKDGTGFPVEFISRPIVSDGKTVGAVLTFKDITERKRMEMEIERLNTDLAVRAAELEAANRGLEAANRELEAFNYTVAHDLRKPLTVVNSYCQALREMCSDKLNEQCNGYLREAYDGTWRMNRLIDALLNFSRLAHVEPHRETVDLSAMARWAAEELKLAEPGRRVTFLIADGVCADGDASMLQVVLTNLLGNAWKFTCTRDEGRIEIGTTEVDGELAYFVRDNGTGFDMTNAGKLFIPFQRLPGAEECRGFGIGLATVERIIQRHGGRVWAKGEPGKGAIFYFTLANCRD